MGDVTSFSHKLNCIRPDFFPPLLGADDAGNADDIKNRLLEDSSNIVRAVSGLKIHVRPKTEELDINDVVSFDEEISHKELFELGDTSDNVSDTEEKNKYKQEIVEAIDAAKNYVPADKESQSDGVSDYPIVTFLGTGSSIPSKYRNVSNILVETSHNSFIILDCGEGSISQMVRLFGETRSREILRNLKCVYISHMHADHHLGLINIVQYRDEELSTSEAGRDKLYIVATDRLVQFWINYHAKFEPLLTNCEFVKCERLILYQERDEATLEENPNKRFQKLYPRELKEFLQHVGLSEFYTCRAIHCPNAFCAALRTEDGFKFSYSGDTRPCEKFRDISTWGGSPDLLIHEATMEHFMMMDAIIKKHSTFTEAIQEGRAMGAKFTMLTHFSQRYAKIPVFEEIQGQPNVGVAFDNMVVHKNNWRSIPGLYPALSR